MTDVVPPWLPPGSREIGYYAATRRLLYAPKPDEAWFRAWEPHDTMISPENWYNAVTDRNPMGTFVVAEAWTAGEAVEPLERTIVGFAQLRGGPARRAAMRVGEPFMTKVAFLEMPPPPKVALGDKVWDEHVTTFAASASEAAAAFPKRLRELLRSRGFRGHLEIRPGGFVVHHEGYGPRPETYDTMFRMLSDIARALQQA
ncbi:MAG TPA: hypothetical protein VL400_03910 [Polyangiaceae bacterium]|jgi:hypothetical protein|nr:hypothetical protein [Polyangiaceae bacterium]